MSEVIVQQPLAEQEQLTGLLLTLHDRELLVPNTAVAELVAWQVPEALPGGVQKDGLIGRINWRGLRLPLVSFEALAGEDVPEASGQTRIAIFNSLDATAGAGFYGVMLQRIPRTLQLDSQLLPDSQAELRHGELQAVQVGGQCIYIPDLEGLEQGLLRARLQQRF